MPPAMPDDALILDAVGLKCPLPVLRARKRLRDVPCGELMEVRADDPAAPGDFEAFCRETGHALLGLEENGGVFTILIRKAR